MIINVVGHLLCSKLVVSVWRRWIILLLFITICVLWPRCLHCCPQINDFSQSDVRPEELSCAVPFDYKSLSFLPNVQISAVLAALNSISYITPLMLGCFVLMMDMFLPQRVARLEVNWDNMFIGVPPESLWYSCNLGNDDVVMFSQRPKFLKPMCMMILCKKIFATVSPSCAKLPWCNCYYSVLWIQWSECKSRWTLTYKKHWTCKCTVSRSLQSIFIMGLFLAWVIVCWKSFKSMAAVALSYISSCCEHLTN